MENNFNTKIKCSLTACKYNTACCISSDGEHFCTKDEISIDLDLDDEDNTIPEFTCVTFKSGKKPVKCILCQVLERK